jgi:hypothetical protein
VRIASLVAHPLVLLTFACGGTSTHHSPGGAGTGDAGAPSGAGAGPIGGASDACPDPVSEVPASTPFEPPIAPSSTFQLTLRNRCAKTVWPAWSPAGGLDNSVIDTAVWLPLSPTESRTVVVYGGLRDLGFWGRTSCSFDQNGVGACETGDCGAFACPSGVAFPKNATVFVLKQGFLGGYNVGLGVAGVSCGEHACFAEVSGCTAASAVKDACGATVACSDICNSSTPECCNGSGSRCDEGEFDHEAPQSDDLVVTFCP